MRVIGRRDKFVKYLATCISRGRELLSLISYRSVKMTSNYPTSCLEVRRKQKVNKPIFKGYRRKNICKYQHFNHIVFSCSACLQKENCLSDNHAIIVRYAYIKHEACTKFNLHCTMSLFPITKMVELLLLSHDRVWNIMCIKTICRTRNCKACLCVSCGYSRKNQDVRRNSSEVIMTRQRA